jgi:serine phosphatase RsbU (regulator of sigma subunit)
MARRLSRSEVERFFASLSSRSRLKLFAAIFFLLAPVGVLSTTRMIADRPLWTIVGHAALAGLAGMGWAAAFIYNLRWLFLVVPLHLTAYTLLERFDPMPTQGLGIVIIALIALSYVFFISLVSGEGVSKVRLQTEIDLAQDIHRSLVPALERTGPDIEFYGRSVPSSAVGGDLLDVVEHDGRLVLCVADVVGHGVPAGVILGMVKSAVRTRVLTHPGDGSPLPDVDRILTGMLTPGLFVTCATVAIGRAGCGYVSAGHLPLLRYDAQAARIERLSESGPPLATGVAPRSGVAAVDRWHAFDFHPGDLLVLVTDGITEVFDRAGAAFGMEPIEAIVREHAQAALPTIYAQVMDAARRHGPQLDDQTLLIVRRKTG